MDRKTEIKRDILKILRDVYCIKEEKATARQEDFLDRVVDYLDANISLRRKVGKDKPVIEEKQKDEYVNPDRAKFDS